ncbi:hypothetical protein QFC21_004002 [Naganishia friedmannii]|uniref:Uncharacterized protein n=1 Tax=Naganishia friedmannii TaxID=89922 RepID=A0ACC2VJ78_9TREE|nr:hypothetical protein QFC21_004002 [Naganishia friedmannii]
MQAHTRPPSTATNPNPTNPAVGGCIRAFAGTRHKRQNAIVQGNYLEAAGRRVPTDFVFVSILKDSCIVNSDKDKIHLAPMPHVKPKLAPLVTVRAGKRTTPPTSALTTPHHSPDPSAVITANSAAMPRLNVARTLDDSALLLAAGSPYSLTPTATVTRCRSSLLGSNEPTPLAYHQIPHRSDASSTLTPGKHAALERKYFFPDDIARENERRATNDVFLQVFILSHLGSEEPRLPERSTPKADYR